MKEINKSKSQHHYLDVDGGYSAETWNSVLPVQLCDDLSGNLHRRHDAESAAFADAFFHGNRMNFLAECGQEGGAGEEKFDEKCERIGQNEKTQTKRSVNITLGLNFLSMASRCSL